MTRSRPLTLADLSAADREHLDLCVHEASHAVVGVALGAQLHRAVVAGGRVTGMHGLTRFEPDDFPEHRNAEVAYAGPYGEAKFGAGGRCPSQRQVFTALRTTGHDDDRVLIASAPADGWHTGRDVVPLLERCWPAIIRTAQKLLAHGEVRHADVLAALDITDGGGHTSAQLACLRSGLRSVPPMTAKKKRVPA
ncbi:hypothetical protein [Mycolicibacterium helvum]|uniref:Peptidase M41 domain-containing protein n=1 Tax=Mycolicibacterium helvum TaxID=1534349 RepID=A0A7I7TF63_9MYCO|nr:hypothetical protein [Mycolicibacterium helvum]BBY67758.1 hypothetical protein MHEL_60010 [Mycolicibacterium helvum]